MVALVVAATVEVVDREGGGGRAGGDRDARGDRTADALLLERATIAPPAGAAEESVTVPVEAVAADDAGGAQGHRGRACATTGRGIHGQDGGANAQRA